jgi:uncharacterized protein (TIRG00374 family)
LNMTNSRQTIIIGITVLVFVLLAVLIVFLDWNEVRQITGKAEWWFTIAALLLTGISYSCLSAGYVVVSRVFGIGTGWWELFEVGLVSSALNNMLGFAGAAGHSLRVQLIRGKEIDAGQVLAASIFHSYLNNVMLLLLLAVGLLSLLFSHVVYGGSAIGLGLISVILVASLVVSTAIIFVPWLKSLLLQLTRVIVQIFSHRDITQFLRELDHALVQGLVTLRGRPLELTLLLGLMVSEWAFQAVALWFCFGALGNTPGTGVLLSGFGIGLSAGNLSTIPGGLGVQEASMAGTYALLGIPFAQAALVAILFRVVYDFIPFFISLPLYTRLIRTR